jgi:mono/diheme cytochrome c family protein
MTGRALVPVLACLALGALGLFSLPGAGGPPAGGAFAHERVETSAAMEEQASGYLPLVAARFPPTGTLTGVVRDVNGPVAGATVRVQTTTHFTESDGQGRFTLTALTPGEPVTLTAWAPGYYIGGGEAHLPGPDGVDLTLTAHATEDNPAYRWLSAFAEAGQEGNCQNCHAEPGNPALTLPFDEWVTDVHAGAARNVRFLTMYNGTDVRGNQSPLTRYACSPDYGCFPLPPDPTQPYYGPGYKLDFAGTAGNCAACHAPVAAVDAPYSVDPNAVTGVGAEGVACDFCHKVWDVRLDAATGSPYPNMPGTLSYEFRRPSEGHQFFAGPLDDVAPGEDTYSPLQRQSQFCAPCHFGAFWDTLVYDSFGEWLASPYSDPDAGQTCQDCHMPPLGAAYLTRPDRGGLARDPATIFGHRMPGASDESLLQNAVNLRATARLEGGQVTVRVDLTNDRTGHHVPTDSPLRHLILLVHATDESGHSLPQLDGPTVPVWGGVGEAAKGYYAGLPGKGFAKVLQELWTNVSPTGAYWNHTRVLSDNRLAAFASDISSYAFAAPAAGAVTLEVTLIYRRAFIELMDQKGWDAPDIVMEEAHIVLDR